MSADWIREARRAGVALSAAGGLPPIRGEAAATDNRSLVTGHSGPSNIHPLASPNDPRLTWIQSSQRQRWMTLPLQYWTPERVEQICRFAISGNLAFQWDLFDLMEDTWPELTECLMDLKDGVAAMELTVMPWALKGQKPTPEAQKKAGIVEWALWNMNPRQDRDEFNLVDTIWNLLDARGKGISILEIDWEMKESPFGALWAPRSTHWVHPRNYAWDLSGDDRLMLDAQAVAIDQKQSPGPFIDSATTFGQPQALLPFPDNKFIIGKLKSRTGHPLNTALLRILGFWWSAANFTAEYFINFAQMFGQPIRWATYDPNMQPADKQTLQTWLANMGSCAYGMFPQGTSLEIKEAAQMGASNPQMTVLDYANMRCRLLIKRQSLTTDAGDAGSKALGEVHERGYDLVKQVCGTWAVQNLRQQLIKAICVLNWGTPDEMPELLCKGKTERNRKATADGIQSARTAGLAIPKSWAYEQCEIPEPEEGDEVIEPVAAAAPFGGPADPTDPADPSNGAPGKPAADPADDEKPAVEAEQAPPDPAAGIVDKKAPAVARAMRAAYTPLVAIIENADSPEAALSACHRYLSELPLEKRATMIEEAMQLGAAAGASNLPQ